MFNSISRRTLIAAATLVLSVSAFAATPAPAGS